MNCIQSRRDETSCRRTDSAPNRMSGSLVPATTHIETPLRSKEAPTTRQSFELRWVGAMIASFACHRSRLWPPHTLRQFSYIDVDVQATLWWVIYAWSEVTSQNPWPRYDRRFVGITWHNVWNWGGENLSRYVDIIHYVGSRKCPCGH